MRFGRLGSKCQKDVDDFSRQVVEDELHEDASTVDFVWRRAYGSLEIIAIVDIVFILSRGML